jgi:hypothetical protein
MALILGLVTLQMVTTGCTIQPPDWRGAKPKWSVPITTEAQAIEAAKFVSTMKVGVEVVLVDRGTLDQMNPGFVGRLPKVPEVNGVRIDDVWRVELASPPSGRGTYLFHGQSGIFIEGLMSGTWAT